MTCAVSRMSHVAREDIGRVRASRPYAQSKQGPFQDDATALGLAERFRLAIAALRLTVSEGEIGLTASFGVAVDRGGCADDLLRRADTALYSGKRVGRKRVIAG